MSTLIVEICKIDEVTKHPNADRLSIVTIKGWHCIVGLNDYVVGDAIIFIPPDSIMPSNLIDEYNLEYLKSKSHRSQGRVRTVKLRGCISQGLVMPLSILNKGKPCRLKLGGIVSNMSDKVVYPKFGYGTNVAELLGITKYEPREPSFQMFKPKITVGKLFKMLVKKEITLRRFIFKTIGIIKDSFRKKKNINPNFNQYTHIENIKHYNTVFELGDVVDISEKIHGTNFRAGVLRKEYKIPMCFKKICQKWFGEYEFVYGSHKVQITGHRGRNCFYGEDVYGQIAKRYQLKDIILEGYIIYGEIYGKGIQKGYNYGLPSELREYDIDVVFFDLKKDGEYVSHYEFYEFCRDRKLPTVPILYQGMYPGLDKVKEMTKGNSVLCEEQKMREGVVVKSYVEENNHNCGRKILKAISEDYLLIKDNTEFH